MYNLQNVAKDCNMEISTEKTKIMAFQGKYPIQSKIYIYNKIMEQVNYFKYTRYYMVCENEKDVAGRFKNFN
jgi:hypothetical protein